MTVIAQDDHVTAGAWAAYGQVENHELQTQHLCIQHESDHTVN